IRRASSQNATIRLPPRTDPSEGTCSASSVAALKPAGAASVTAKPGARRPHSRQRTPGLAMVSAESSPRRNARACEESRRSKTSVRPSGVWMRNTVGPCRQSLGLVGLRRLLVGWRLGSLFSDYRLVFDDMQHSNELRKRARSLVRALQKVQLILGDRLGFAGAQVERTFARSLSLAWLGALRRVLRDRDERRHLDLNSFRSPRRELNRDQIRHCLCTPSGFRSALERRLDSSADGCLVGIRVDLDVQIVGRDELQQLRARKRFELHALTFCLARAFGFALGRSGRFLGPIFWLVVIVRFRLGR